MELNTMFPNLNAKWVRWSDYRVVKTTSGQEYIMPSEYTRHTVYDAAEDTKQLVTDALDAGQKLFENQTEYIQPTMEFVRKYGTLGWMTALPLDQEFYEEEQTYLGTNGALLNQVKMMRTREFIAHFFPMGNVKKQSGMAQVIGYSESYNLVFSDQYGEPLLWTARFLYSLYEHFYCAVHYRENDLTSDEKVVMQNQTTRFENRGFRFSLSAPERPEMVWESDSLKTVIETAYALAITNKASPLKMCKHCRKAYYNANARSEFCSVKCRNHYNVIAFRERSKEQSV